MGSDPLHFHVAIVGSGFGGLGTAIRLKREGIDDFVVLERAGDVGGTWRDNTYPGCACDVESHLYSLSFALEPDWPYRFSRQPEIWQYLQRCARDFGVLPHIRFHHQVTGAAWEDSNQLVSTGAGAPPPARPFADARSRLSSASSEHGRRRRCWRIETTQGALTATLLVLATGPLSEPIVPELPGLPRFEGTVFHSARWNHEFDLTGRRVAVVGTGASAVQFVPEIQPKVANLHLFQRTPGWVIPRLDSPIPEWRRRLYRRLPVVQRAVRLLIYLYREVWVFAFRRPAMMRRVQRLAIKHLERSIADPHLRAKLTPNYTLGCKRMLLSNDYYPALAQPNVEVVTGGIAEVRARSILGRDGIERPIDAIIFGTGFRPTDPPLAAAIRGRDGQALSNAWQGSPKAYLGTTVAGFPNLFILLGPNTGLGHNSVVYMTEAQIDHFIGAVKHMRRHGVDALEPAAAAQGRFVEAVDRRMRGTVWVSGGCDSWYLDRTGRNSALWPDSSWSFYRRVSAFDPREYVVHGR